MLRRFFRRRRVAFIAGPQPVNHRNPSQASERDGVPRRVASADPAVSEARLQAALAGLDAVMSSTAAASSAAIAATQIGGQP